MSIGDFFRIKKKALQIQQETIRRYYRKSLRFALADFLFGCIALFINPFRACRKNGFVYGETPPVMFQKMAAVCDLGPDDIWLELGSGRGKGVFWISQFVGCFAVGVEKVPSFVFFAKAIGRILNIKASFEKKDLMDADFSKATCVYLDSTCMQEEELKKLTEKMALLPKGAKVITVSTPMPENSYFECVETFPLSFLWGETEGYLHRRK